VETVTTTATRATAETAARTQTPIGACRVFMRDFRRITIQPFYLIDTPFSPEKVQIAQGFRRKFLTGVTGLHKLLIKLVLMIALFLVQTRPLPQIRCLNGLQLQPTENLWK
jgi:hypothetical protein